MDGSPIENQICCPVSVSVVRESFGDCPPTQEIAARTFDRAEGIYGCWPRAAQVLSEGGLDAWIERFRSVEEAAPYFRAGIPIIISLKIRKGDLPEDPDYQTSGHIVVIYGLDESGGVWMSDPGMSRRENGQRTYARAGIEKAWIANGGVGILAAPRSLQLPARYFMGRSFSNQSD